MFEKSISKNLNKVLPFIPSGVTLVAAVKSATNEQIDELLKNKINNLGFNTAQHLLSVSAFIQDSMFHFIGHLQQNKIKKVVPVCDLVHSVDSVKLAKKISEVAQKMNKVQNILLQVKTDKEKEYGFNDVNIAYKEILNLPNINVNGLMTVPSPYVNPKYIYRNLRLLKDNLGLKDLSIGMSNDYRIAIEEGATIVRIGKMLFN
ncbi:MAG: YggS family pyridoxal phosphate-dependent enzyme [archaeon]